MANKKSVYGSGQHLNVDIGDGCEAEVVAVMTVDANGALVPASDVVSLTNSTAVNLANAGVFTGTAVNVVGYGSITVSMNTSHASATNGLSLQQSLDGGSTWPITDTYTVAAGTKTVTIPAQAPHFRLVYTNGGTLTTTLQIVTKLNMARARDVSVKPTDAMSVENDFDQGISAQMSYNGTSLDLTRSVANATNSTGTGIQAAGLVAQLDDTSPTTITENQFGNLRMAPNRSLLVYPNASPADSWSYAAAASGIVNSTTAVTIKTAAAAGIRNYLKSLDIATDTLGAATELAIRDGAAGTVLWRGKLGTAALPQNSILFDPPLRGTAATLMEVVTLTASVTGAVYINAHGFTGP
jgi:hypothetical protein